LPTYFDYKKHIEKKHSDFYRESKKGEKTQVLATALMGAFACLLLRVFYE